MTRMQTIVVVVLALAAGAGAFLIGRGTGQAVSAPPAAATCPVGLGPSCNECDALAGCLGLSAEEARKMAQADPDFGPQARALRSSLVRQRHLLARLLEDPTSSDKALMQQVERVIAAHDALERRAAEHVLVIRRLLTPPQAKRLMGLTAKSVRSGGRWCSCCPSTGCGACHCGLSVQPDGRTPCPARHGGPCARLANTTTARGAR